jgi:hypothetical protein
VLSMHFPYPNMRNKVYAPCHKKISNV